MAVIPGQSHDITITDTAGNEIGFMLYREEGGPPAWSRRSLPSAGQNNRDEATNPNETTWRYPDVSLGFAQFSLSPESALEDQRRYALADAIFTGVPKEITLAAQVQTVTVTPVTTNSIIKFVPHEGKLYALTADFVMRLDATFVSIKSTSGATDLISFGGSLIFARGTTGAYEYSDDPEVGSPTWTVSTLTGNTNRDNDAKFFTVTRDVLFKALDPAKAAFTSGTNFKNGGLGWTEISVGDVDSNFTSLHSFDDVPVAGKEDGLWHFDRTSAVFFDVTPYYREARDPDNIKQSVSWESWYWYSGRYHTLERFDGFNSQELSVLLENTQFPDITGRIMAMGTDIDRLYILMDSTDTDDTDNEKSWLLSLREVTYSGIGAFWIVDTLYELNLGGDTGAIIAFNGDLFVASRLSVSGTVNATCVKINLPGKGIPAEAGITLQTSGTIITPYWDSGFSHETKENRLIHFLTEGCDTNHTVQVEVEVDADIAFTNLTTITTNGYQTLSINALAPTKNNSNRIRYRFTLTTNDTTSPKVVFPIHSHFTVRSSREHDITFRVYIAENMTTLSGIEQVDVATTIATLNNYLEEKFTVTLQEDLDRDGTITSYNVNVDEVSLEKEFESPLWGHTWVYQIRATETAI